MKKELETMKAKLMTRLALAAAVVALALGAKAEMLYWSATGIKSSPANTLTSSGQYLAYIFADAGSGPTTGASAANMFTTAGNTVTSLSTVLERLYNNQDISDLAYYNATGKVRAYESSKGRLNNYTAASGTASYDACVGWIGVGGTVNLFAVILDGTTFETSKNYMIATTTDGTQVLTQKTTSNAESTNMKNVYFEWGSQENNSWHAIGTIPEPTSGLLLLVGLSALALRRKKAVF